VSPRESSISGGYNDIKCTLDTDTPPRKVKFLKEVYESCTFAHMIAKPTCYEDVAEK